MVEDWERARQSGAYTTSTRGVSLEQEGFLHAARREQVAGVFNRYYRDADEPLVLLTIDTDRLDVPWREDPVGTDTFPHIYGPLSPRAVVGVERLNAGGGTEPFVALFMREMMLRFGLAILAAALAGIGWLVFGSGIAAFLGLAVGAVVATVVPQRRRRGVHLTRRRWRWDELGR